MMLVEAGIEEKKELDAAGIVRDHILLSDHVVVSRNGRVRMLRRFVILVGLSVGLSAVVEQAVTLQQGLNGYSGCADSFIASGGYSESRYQNFGHASEFRIACSHYASW